MIADNQMHSRDARFESQAKYKGKPDPLFEKKASAQPKEVKRLSHRGRDKVNTQWNLYCMVHNIEKLANSDLGHKKVQ